MWLQREWIVENELPEDFDAGRGGYTSDSINDNEEQLTSGTLLAELTQCLMKYNVQGEAFDEILSLLRKSGRFHKCDIPKKIHTR